MWAFVAFFQTGQPQSRFMQIAWGLSENFFKAVLKTHRVCHIPVDTCLPFAHVLAVLEKEIHS